jgi:hypothetical protein
MNTIGISMHIILATQILVLLEISALSVASFSVSSQFLAFIIW